MNEKLKILNGLKLKAYLSLGDLSYLDEFYDSIPTWHIDMLKDSGRLEFYEASIKKKVKDKIVLDIGTGSGILSYLAIKHGAKHVYSVEINPLFQEVYRVLMEGFLLEGKASLIEKDARHLSKEDFEGGNPEIIIHEIFSHDLFSENIVEVFTHLKRAGLFDGVEFVPASASLCADGLVLPSDTPGETPLQDFQGYPLSKLVPLAAKVGSRLGYRESQKLVYEKACSPKVLYQTQFLDFPSLDLLTYAIEQDESPTHLRIWLKLESDGEVLETLHEKGPSHWSNAIFSIPQWQRRTTPSECRFSVQQNRLVFHGSFAKYPP